MKHFVLFRTLFALGLLIGHRTTASAAEPDIWDAPVLAQPFDHAPFRAIRVPEWLRGTLGVGYTMSGMNTAQRERAAAAGVTISEFGFVDPFYAYYDSKLLAKRSPYVPLERLDKDMAEYRRLGIRLLGVYPPCLQGEVYEKHPEWRRIATNTREIPSIDMQKFPHGGMLCLLGPYGDFFIEVLAEIVTKYPAISAFSFDGLHYAGVCYCANCRENYRKDTGNEIPDVNMDDPAFRHYQHWADRRMESLIQRMQTRLKGINPNVALVTWTTNAGRFGHFRDIPRNMPARMNLLLDAPDQEFWMDETNRGASIVPAFGNAYAWATTNHRVAFSEPYLMSHGNPYGKDSFPGHEIERRMLLVLTHGALPSLAVGQPAAMQEAAYHALGEVQKRKPWLTDKAPEPWAALVMSDNTRVFYGRNPGLVEERYLANVFGFFRAGLEEHLPLTLINDWNLTTEELAKYKVLILANTACLDDAQCAAVRGFVERGGGLVASLDVSLCNEFGDTREDFALADVLGVHHRGAPTVGASGAELDVNFARNLSKEYWDKRKNVWDLKRLPGNVLESSKLSELIGNEIVNFKGQAVRVAVDPGTQTLATLEPKPDAKGETVPAIVTHPFGKGRVVYFAAGIDGANYLYSYPYHRVLLRNAIDWAAAAPAPITVEAPMCVHAVAMRQTKDGERLVMHLYNDVNTTANHARPDDDIPLREETLPIHDIRITFHGYKLGRIHLEPGGLDLPAQPAPDGVSVTVPRLDIHAMVVAELVP
jgi:hypothetical protein